MDQPAFALPDHRLVALHGRDALAFAQAQFMGDIDALADHQWQWSGWLTPKGRVVALFALLRVDAESAWLVLHDADPVEFAQRLQRYVFRSKLSIDVRDDLRVDGAFDARPAAAGATAAPVGDGFALDFGGAGGARTLRVGAPGTSPADAEAAARWAVFDLAHGLPRLPPSQAEQWTPQQLSLDRLRAYSVKKGCYPGQEIVARTHFLGQAKRGLVLFEADAPLAAGAQVMDGERAAGTIVSVADAGQRHRALAVLPLDQAIAVPVVDGRPLRRLALLDGLAR
ncbi:MAG TPA: folate-binding protein [Luteimonas sp.]|nr:folate-binding protein [Luteimonas sp.]